MKLSVRWIFDHLKVESARYTPEKLVSLLNAKTAEVESYTAISWDFSEYVLATLVSHNDQTATLFIPEFDQKITVSVRSDLLLGGIYLLKREKKEYRWATHKDWHGDKEYFLPAFYCTARDLKGGWRKGLETQDYILEVDNKSITNRPDLWGHRGFARELSILLDVPLIDEKSLLTQIPTSAGKKSTPPRHLTEGGLIVKITDQEACKRFAALSIADVQARACALWMAQRLVSINARPLSLIVDATNYVMFDIGRPLHAFDAQYFKKGLIDIRKARKDEQITLLDGAKLDLTHQDLVVTNGEVPVALAGIMGSLSSSVTMQTHNLVIESAIFDPTVIRLTGARHKLRTEASARFEKTLDPNYNIEGIERFVKLLEQERLPMTVGKTIVSVGKPVAPLKIRIKHEFIENRLGVTIGKQFVKKTLAGLGFMVQEKAGSYTIEVPTMRSSKDITLPEDIVEELGRLYGYDHIPEQLPAFKTVPADHHELLMVRTAKYQLAFGSHMHEVENYGFFDNSFLQHLGYKPVNPVLLANSISEQRTLLVTSLVPHLLQNVATNSADHDQLSFFEWARTWHEVGKQAVECKVLAGIFYSKKEVDFFWAKQELINLFQALGIEVTWAALSERCQWAHTYQSADLMHAGKIIGKAAKVTQRLMTKIGGGDAFAFEIDGDQLCAIKKATPHYVPLAKYQATALDVSMMVPAAVSVEQLTQLISKAHSGIFQVTLIDEFKKPDWKDEKSITMRYWMRDNTKTITKTMIDEGIAAVNKAVQTCGARIR